MNTSRMLALTIANALGLSIAACGPAGTTSISTPAPTAYVLTVNSASPANGVAIVVTPKDNNNTGNGSTSFTRTYNAGTAVTLTAPATSGSNTFASWSGCESATTVTCNVTLAANTTVTANYIAPTSAVTYYVSGTGNDSADGLTIATAFLTLQHAANVTQPGDTVYVMNGTYSNSCPSCDVLDITIPGTATNWITYKAYPGQAPIISFNGWEGIFFEPTAAYVEVNGFTVIGNNANVTLAQALAQSTSNPNPIFNGNCIASDGRMGTATVRPNHITPAVTKATGPAILRDGGLVDAYRRVHPDDPQFTWWDYRAGNFHKGLGLRIDLALVSRELAGQLVACGIDRNFRKGKKPSDHAPLLVELS